MVSWGCVHDPVLFHKPSEGGKVKLIKSADDTDLGGGGRAGDDT